MKDVIYSFGDEWTRFDQNRFLPLSERKSQFLRYFNTYHFSELKKLNSIKAIDVGAGSGRWAQEIFNHLKISEISIVEPSNSFELLKKIFSKKRNVTLIKSSIQDLLKNNSYLYEDFDLAYSFGVLHHTESISEGFNELCKLVRPGGYVFCYLYYKLDNRSYLYKIFYKLTILPRLFISRFPSFLKNIICDLIAIFIYFPVIKFAKCFPDNKQLPLHGYIDRSFFSMRTDARDRFGTKIEKRISKKEIGDLCKMHNLIDLSFSEEHPFWVFSARKTH